MSTADDLDRIAKNAAPCLESEDFDGVLAAMREGLLGRGPQGEAFEQELAQYLGVAEVVTVASGTVALQLALTAAGVEPGDDVLVPSFTFCASIQAILAAGARPVFVDNAPRSLTLDPGDVVRAVTPRTRAVMPVHYGGRHVDLDPILPALRQGGISVVDDAAHAFGSVRADGAPFTGRDAWVCFSFDAIKNITCAEGGAIVPPRSATGELPRLHRALGIDRHRHDLRGGDYVVRDVGVRAHLAELNSALGRSQLRRMDAIAADRRRVWRAYRDHLAALADVRVYDVDIDHTVPFNCAVTVEPGIRDDLVRALRAAGIGVGRHYPANHLQPAFRRYAERPLPHAEWAADSVVTLPFGPDMTQRQVQLVCEAVTVALEQVRQRADRDHVSRDYADRAERHPQVA